MKTIDFSGQNEPKTKNPQKDVWYKDLVIIVFLVMVFYYIIFGEVPVV